MSFLPTICQAEVVRVIDGDTYCVEWNNKEYVVRIIGCDCFETRYTRKLFNQSRKHGISLVTAYQRGKAARNFAENTLLNQTVTLTRPQDSPDNDSYYRHLREVEMMWNNVSTNFSTLLIQRNHAA